MDANRKQVTDGMSTQPPASEPDKPQGVVYLIGAGPGDPGLLTLRGAELLRAADVVMFDYLVNPITALYAGEQAELICLGRHGRSRLWTQDEINRKLVELAVAGKQVVRLKSGDPTIFARAAEEQAYLAQHKVRFETIPGITAAMAVGSYAGIPLTHRDWASAVAFVTGQESAEKEVSSIDFAALARFPGTLVIYMGVTTVEYWSGQLIRQGMSPQTPVALVRRCSFPDQQCIRCQLGQVVDLLTPYAKFPPPVLVIIGEVARSSQAATWFEQRPLFGQSVMVTRQASHARQLAGQLSQLGAQVVTQPAIEVQAPDDWSAVDTCLYRLPTFGWLIFSSANGVGYFFRRLESLGLDVRAIGHVQLAAVGVATAAALRKLGLQPDLVPTKYNASSLADELLLRWNGEHCLIVRGSRSTEVIQQRLSAAHVPWTSAEVYFSRDVTQLRPEAAEALGAGSVDWTFVTSPAIGRSLVQMWDQQLKRTQLVSISPRTTAALEQLGFSVALESPQATSDAMIRAVVAAVSGSPSESLSD